MSAVALVVVALATAMAYRQAERRVELAATTKVTATALSLAATDDVIEGLAAPDPAAALRDFAERTRQATGTDFVVVMSPQGVRYTHPNPDLVGGTFVGTIAPAQAGGIVIEDYEGSLGRSTRAVVPVLVDGKVRGLVSVGLRRTRVSEELRAILPEVLLPGLVAAALSGLGAFVVSRRVRRETLGLNALELRRLADHHGAVLHAVREGLVITDADGRLLVINDEAERLLALGPDAVGRPVADLELAEPMRRMLTQGDGADVPLASGGRVLLASSGDVRRNGQRVGTLTTLRDRTELEELTGQLSTAQSLADALHAQAHEAANRLHTVTTLIEVGRPDEAAAFATAELRATQQLRERVFAAIGEPAVAALLLGKASQAAEQGIEVDLDPDADLPAGVVPVRECVLILGNLIDNAIESLTAGPPGTERRVSVDAQVRQDDTVLTVADTGPGLSQEAAQNAFERGWTTKPAAPGRSRGLGLSLVAQTVRLLNGTITLSSGPGATFVVVLPRTPGVADG